MAILNVKALVPIVLDFSSPHYNRWRGLFMNTLERYVLADHVLSDADLSDDPSWKRMEATVLSWLYGTINPELLEAVMNREDGPPIARIVWLGLEQQFIGNKETRALLLDAEFRTFVQGDLTIDDYCRRLKTMADQLADLGEPVRDRTLVLNTLRGLNDRFSYLAALIQRQRPFPSFDVVRSDLRLAEITMKAKQSFPAQAFAASTPRAPTLPSAPPPASNGGSGGRNRTRRGGAKKNGGGGPSAPWSPGQPSWAGFPMRPNSAPPPGWHPAYGTFQAFWASPPGSSRPAGTPQPPRPHSFFAGPQGPYGPPQPGSTPLFQPGPPPPLAPLPLPAGPTGGSAPASWMSHPGGFAWNQDALASSFNTMTLQPPPTGEWYMDTGAETHMTSNSGNLSSSHLPSYSTPSHIVVGDGSLIPVSSTGFVSFPSTRGNLNLNNVLVSLQLIKNLISVRQFTIDNSCSVEFDPYGFSVKDYKTKSEIARCNSSGHLYPLLSSVFHPLALAAGASSATLWHRRLGHLGTDALSRLVASSAISCNKSELEHLCHACQLGRHMRLPFNQSSSRATKNFDLVHCDLWTSPVLSVSGYKYYLVILDDCSHYL